MNFGEANVLGSSGSRGTNGNGRRWAAFLRKRVTSTGCEGGGGACRSGTGKYGSLTRGSDNVAVLKSCGFK